MSTNPPPDVQDRAALLVAAEKAQLAALVTEPEIEIVGVTSFLGAGAIGSPAAGEWALRLHLKRWREIDGPRHGEELRICLITNEAEIDRIVEAIPGPTVVHMRVRLVVPSAPSTGISPVAALLVTLLDSPFEDAEMGALAAKLEADDLALTAAIESPGAVPGGPDAMTPMTMDSFVAAVKKRLPPAPESEVAAFEQSLGCELPEDYRAFLVACNGGYVSGELGFEGLTPSGEEIGVSIHHIGGFREEDYFSLAWPRAIYEERIPDDLLWIMDDPCGNAICLGLRGAHIGRVFFWDHENEPDDDWDGTVEGAGNIELLANTFSEFVARLRPRGF